MDTPELDALGLEAAILDVKRIDSRRADALIAALEEVARESTVALVNAPDAPEVFRQQGAVIAIQTIVQRMRDAENKIAAVAKRIEKNKHRGSSL